MRRTLVVTQIALTGVLALTGCKSADISNLPPAQALQTYVATPAHQAATLAGVQTTARWQVAHCDAPRVTAPSQIVYAAPTATFDAAGAPINAIWMERVVAGGCGPDMPVNIAWIAQNRALSAIGMAPGTTRADPVVQSDIGRIVYPVAQSRVPACPGIRSYIYDTLAPPGAPTGLAPWTERWTIAACNKHVTIPVTITPAHGQYEFQVRGEAAVVE